MTEFFLAQDDEANALLREEPLALLIGMLLDQQIAMELAFAGPQKIAERLGAFDAHTIAGTDPEDFAAACAQKPAVHRFPGSMARRIQTLCQYLVDHYDGDVTALWRDGAGSGTGGSSESGELDGAGLLRRLKDLPGFGDQKARIFLALLGKQLDVAPAGWREAAGAYGEDGTRRSVADVVDLDTREEVRSFKKVAKAAKAADQG